MEHANKAIIMGFGMIVAVLIMGSIVYVFTNLKVFPQGDDSRESVEQLSAFNAEYEVYDKKIMYGVDVISVLNKAKSNNDKYVQGNFLSGLGYNTDYIIDIEVTLKDPLEERLVVTYLDNTINGVVERDYMQNEGPNINANTKFKQPSQEYHAEIYNTNTFWNTLKLKSKIIDTEIGAGTYHLLAGNDSDIVPGEYTNDMLEDSSALKSLLEQAAQMPKTVKNTSGNTEIKRNPMNQIDEENTGWNKATWYQAIYDLKTRKFKCISQETVYSEITGRIIKMAFEEI